MFKRVIIATDLSKDSNALIGCFGRLKAYGVEKCLLVQFHRRTPTGSDLHN